MHRFIRIELQLINPIQQLLNPRYFFEPSQILSISLPFTAFFSPSEQHVHGDSHKIKLAPKIHSQLCPSANEAPILVFDIRPLKTARKSFRTGKQQKWLVCEVIATCADPSS